MCEEKPVRDDITLHIGSYERSAIPREGFQSQSHCAALPSRYKQLVTFVGAWALFRWPATHEASTHPICKSFPICMIGRVGFLLTFLMACQPLPPVSKQRGAVYS